MKLSEIIQVFEDFAPLGYQESYDNSGLLIGERNAHITGAVLCVDVTEEVVDEAVLLGANLIVSHHPLIFGGLKKITGENAVERVVAKILKNDMAVYACHTNIDAVYGGVSFKMGEKIGLQRMNILAPISGDLLKIAVFVPHSHAAEVRDAMFDAGAGTIGEYDRCSFNSPGEGTFRAGDHADPFVGEKGILHVEKEIKIETIVPRSKWKRVVNAMQAAHPYEEVAYDIYPLENTNPLAGFGVIGEMPEEMDFRVFLELLKQAFGLKSLRYSVSHRKTVKRIAMCGGAGSFLIGRATAAQADVFVTGDLKYHDFFGAGNNLMLADIGHYESEQFTIDIFYDLLVKKNSTFAVHKSNCCTNPINYL